MDINSRINILNFVKKDIIWILISKLTHRLTRTKRLLLNIDEWKLILHGKGGNRNVIVAGYIESQLFTSARHNPFPDFPRSTVTPGWKVNHLPSPRTRTDRRIRDYTCQNRLQHRGSPCFLPRSSRMNPWKSWFTRPQEGCCFILNKILLIIAWHGSELLWSVIYKEIVVYF